MGHCPECGFRLTPGSRACPHCGNRNFQMTLRVFWDDCDRCGNGSASQGANDGPCPACSGKGFREYRVTKDARDGSLWCERFDSVLRKFYHAPVFDPIF